MPYDGKYTPIEYLPKLQSMMDIRVVGEGAIENVQFCFRKPEQVIAAWIDRNGPDYSSLTDDFLSIPYTRLQGRRIRIDFTGTQGQTGTIVFDFTLTGDRLD